MNSEDILSSLSEKTRKRLQEIGYQNLTDIQLKVIPLILEQKDIIAQSQTGTGKTAAFLVPILERLEAVAQPQVLVLEPVRELARQVSEEAKNLSSNRNLKIMTICGGETNKNRQARDFRQGVDIVVGTPGRITYHLQTKSFRTDQLKFLVLDEVDEMINEGFLPSIKRIVQIVQRNTTQCQILLFSATISPDVKVFAQQFLNNPQLVISEKEKNKESNIQQYYIETPSWKNKPDILTDFLHSNQQALTLIFANTKRQVEIIKRQLGQKKLIVDYIHGGLPQGLRTKILNKFRNKQINILVATDVMGRGIHVNNINYVINYDFPQSSKSYIHRIGRTGRAETKGKSITLVTKREKGQLLAVSRQQGFKMEIFPMTSN